MMSKRWLDQFEDCFQENGYRGSPHVIYADFVRVVNQAGKILELACGNGLLLRYLVQHSPYDLQPFGVDVNSRAIQRARTAIFPERQFAFMVDDLRVHDFCHGPFSTIITNPLYADQGYYEQLNGKIQRLYADGSISRYVLRCAEHLNPRGRLILWCYAGQLDEIKKWRASFQGQLEVLSLYEQPSASGAITFWISDRTLPRGACS